MLFINVQKIFYHLLLPIKPKRIIIFMGGKLSLEGGMTNMEETNGKRETRRLLTHIKRSKAIFDSLFFPLADSQECGKFS